MESLCVKLCDLNSRKEVNKHISALNMYYVYGGDDNCTTAVKGVIKTLVMRKIDRLREYKNIHFPKVSLITRLLRSMRNIRS